jgi:hypothetical protein
MSIHFLRRVRLTGPLIRLAAALTGLDVTFASAQPYQDTLSLFDSGTAVRSLDPNGLLLNPGWLRPSRDPPDVEKLCRFRVGVGALANSTLYTTGLACLSPAERRLVTLDQAGPTLGLGFACMTSSEIGNVRGHVNWFPVTATGQMRWNSYSGGLPGDNDLSFAFATAGTNATTSGNWVDSLGRRTYHVEFDYQETISRDTVPKANWWEALRRSVDSGTDERAMHALVDRRFAIVTGIFSLDAVHDFKAELHPVFAMSVLIDTNVTRTGVREQWAVMVRNTGNQGDCATGTLSLILPPIDTLQYFVLNLGAWNGGGTPDVSLDTSSSWVTHNAQPPLWRMVRDSIYVAFRFAHPTFTSGDFVFLGTIYVNWASSKRWEASERLRGWLPTPVASINLDSLDSSKLTRPSAKRPVAIPKHVPGRTAILAARTSHRFPTVLRVMRTAAPHLESIPDSWKPRPTVLADPSPAVLPYEPVQPLQCSQASHQGGDLLCVKPVRIIVAATTEHFPSAMAAFYVYAHGFSALEGLGTVGQALSSVGWRLEVRNDAFQRHCTSQCPAVPVTLTGVGARLSAIPTPNSLTLLHVKVTPYSIAGAGVSLLKGTPHFSWNSGFGIRSDGYLNPFPFPLTGGFLELENYNAPGLVSHWSVAGGLLFHL